MVQKYIIDKSDLPNLIQGKELALEQGNKFRAFCIEINGKMTNGDVVMAVFPNIDFYEGEVDKIGGLISFYAKDEHEEKRQRVIITADWWNAPYKAGDTDG